MKTFKEFISESSKQLIHRIDNTQIDNFNHKLNTYHHTADWTESGQAHPKDIPEEGFVKSKGLFGGDLHAIAPYTTPRGTRFIQHYDDKGKSNIMFHVKDKHLIIAHQPTLSSFPKSRFKYLENSGEHFSINPGIPIQQIVIKNPINFMKRQGHKVIFVPNLDHAKKKLEQSGINHNVEGEFE